MMNNMLIQYNPNNLEKITPKMQIKVQMPRFSEKTDHHKKKGILTFY